MFGLVKASRLRDAEADLHAKKVESGEWENSAKSNLKQCKEWESLYLAERKDRRNWRAIADSRLVAVLLLRERWDKQYTMADAAIRMDHAHVRNYERTIESMEERENAIAAQRDAAIANGTQYAIERNNVSQSVQPTIRHCCGHRTYPGSGTAAYRNGDHPPVQHQPLAVAGQR